MNTFLYQSQIYAMLRTGKKTVIAVEYFDFIHA